MEAHLDHLRVFFFFGKILCVQDEVKMPLELNKRGQSTTYQSMWLKPPCCAEPLFPHMVPSARQRKVRANVVLLVMCLGPKDKHLMICVVCIPNMSTFRAFRSLCVSLLLLRMYTAIHQSPAQTHLHASQAP